MSVIVPTGNWHTALIETLESIAERDYRSLEVIVVDDGSDRPVAPSAVRDCRCQVIRLPGNGGPAVIRNAGMAEPIGDYVCFVDYDDLLNPRAIRRRVATWEAAGPSVGVYYSELTLVTPEGKVLAERCPDYEGDVLREIIQLNSVGARSAIMC